MKIFQRHNVLDVDLGNLTMDEILNLPDKQGAGLEEFYIKEVIAPNHVQVDVKSRDSYNRGIHTFEYEEPARQIVVSSKYPSSAFFIYASILFPLTPLILSKGQVDNKLELIGITLALFVGVTILMVIGIRSQSKEIEREMILRVNYLRANKS